MNEERPSSHRDAGSKPASAKSGARKSGGKKAVGQKRIDSLLRLYRELESEWKGALTDVKTSREGTGVDDDTESIAQMLTTRMDQIVDHRREVEDALERLADGTYGICEDCGTRIPAARLEANPAAVRCVACQDKADRRR